MQFPESWLRQFCNPDLTTEGLAETLTMAGLEVEDVHPAAPMFSGVVVGQVRAVQPHPNADKLRVTGAKFEDKKYYRHSGYPGGIYETNFRKMQERHPGRALEKAVKGMLPKGPLGYAMIKKMKVYAGSEHPHSAQQPQVLDI